MTFLEACEAQGARCGYIDGRARAGVYVMGEEYLVDVADQGRGAAAHVAFVRGYVAGYRVGADGEELDRETLDAPLPEECKP